MRAACIPVGKMRFDFCDPKAWTSGSRAAGQCTVYTELTNNWYSVTGAATKPVMLLQSIRIDGKQVQDGYAIRLDNTLPKRDPRDRDPGVPGCR